jgi:GT2 family glycosyltransferase
MVVRPGDRGRRDGRVARRPPVTICVLVYGDYAWLARRTLESIRGFCRREEYRLIVGANAAGSETLAYLRGLELEGALDRLLVSKENLHKSPMMRRMLRDVDTPLIWWFDDDSYVVERGAMEDWLKWVRAAPPRIVLWGQGAECGEPASFTTLEDVSAFVRSAAWYRGLPPPSWRPGGKGEFNFEGRGTGDGRWIFVLGGCWMARTRAIGALDWPDRRLVRLGDDVLLGEAIRQRGWAMGNIGAPGVRLDTEPRRGA